MTSIVLVFFLAANSWAGAPHGQEPSGASAANQPRYSYKFENPRFYIRRIEIDLNDNGTGQLRFTRGESDEVVDLNLKLLPATISRIRVLFDASGFLESEMDYQDKKHAFPNMGWMTLGMRQGASERKARFNYTTNAQIKELEGIFRGIASQEIALFDIDNAERYQPLDVPKQLEILENDLGLERITEPERLLSALNEIAHDDTQTLIARNQAKKLVESIKKGKFKTPIRKQ